jgi:hypothetical protein
VAQTVPETGKVLDSSSTQSTYVTGSTTNTSTDVGGTVSPDYGGGSTVNARANSTGNMIVHRVSVQTNELLIAGDTYLYVICDERRKGGPILSTALHNRHHGCRFIVGEDIRYAQEMGDLYVIDADGNECKTPILPKQRREPEAAK